MASLTVGALDPGGEKELRRNAGLRRAIREFISFWVYRFRELKRGREKDESEIPAPPRFTFRRDQTEWKKATAWQPASQKKCLTSAIMIHKSPWNFR